jgi:hypothetical protein
MINPERAKLIPVSGNNDSPDLPNAVDVQFNPTTLKVSLANTLKENQRSGNSRAAQYVDKSSSSLTVELIFDTTYIDDAVEQEYIGRAQQEGRRRQAVQIGSDVRLLTRRIAETFLKPIEQGKKQLAPKRCLFQWGGFEFVGLLQSFEETLDFFSPEGRPLRSTVSLKLSEDRYQFRGKDVDQEARKPPQLTPTGNNSGKNPAGNGAAAPSQDTSPVPGGSGGSGSWRDTALFNGIESPRLPSADMLAVPQVSASASIGISGGLGASATLSGSASATAKFGAVATAGGSFTPPAFSFGASGSLGTGIAGAFAVSPGAGSGLAAGSLANGGVQLRADARAGTSASAHGFASASASASAGVAGATASASASVRDSVGFD